jgi:hypothetical protein
MSDATMMMRMGDRDQENKDHGWFVREGPVADHFRVWPLVLTVLFPCIGAMLVGFDMGATAWLVRDGGSYFGMRFYLFSGFIRSPMLAPLL